MLSLIKYVDFVALFADLKRVISIASKGNDIRDLNRSQDVAFLRMGKYSGRE